MSTSKRTKGENSAQLNKKEQVERNIWRISTGVVRGLSPDECPVVLGKPSIVAMYDCYSRPVSGAITRQAKINISESLTLFNSQFLDVLHPRPPPQHRRNVRNEGARSGAHTIKNAKPTSHSRSTRLLRGTRTLRTGHAREEFVSEVHKLAEQAEHESRGSRPVFSGHRERRSEQDNNNCNINKNNNNDDVKTSARSSYSYGSFGGSTSEQDHNNNNNTKMNKSNNNIDPDDIYSNATSETEIEADEYDNEDDDDDDDDDEEEEEEEEEEAYEGKAHSDVDVGVGSDDEQIDDSQDEAEEEEEEEYEGKSRSDVDDDGIESDAGESEGEVGVSSDDEQIDDSQEEGEEEEEEEEEEHLDDAREEIEGKLHGDDGIESDNEMNNVKAHDIAIDSDSEIED